MKTKRQTIEAVTSGCLILAVAGSLLSFAGDTEARGRGRRQRVATGPPSIPQSGDSGKTDTGGKQEAPANQADPAIVAPPPAVAYPTALSRTAHVSLPAVSLTGIQVSFKPDPRYTKGLPMGEAWVAPPIALHTSGQDGATATVEARAQALDAKGQPVDLSPEWIAADSEMVTVTPIQGNEVKITVRRAGQSSMLVMSQNVSKELSVMAWYQDDALQVEISQTP